MKLTQSKLKEIIREELQNLNESQMGRAQMYVKSLTKDASRLLAYLKKGDTKKADYFVKEMRDALDNIDQII